LTETGLTGGFYCKYILSLPKQGKKAKFSPNLLQSGKRRIDFKKSIKKSEGIKLKTLTFAVQKICIMARVCQLTGKVPVGGNKVSHSNIKTKRRFLPNLQTKRFFLAEEDKWVTLKVSTEAIRTINKRGLYSVVKELRAKGEHI
jgi:large subunit ribosomal protein L28